MITWVEIFIELGAETVNIIINLRIKRDPGEGGAGGGGAGEEKMFYLVQIIIDQWWIMFLAMIDF